ncbi:hypothetical protein GF389_04530 [Candidatus Dojkabacteria bacterium]|nr:hypothetical protein [Candidatus Dojkabacteria bacterium]
MLIPANGANVYTNDVFVDWTDVSSWGTGCPQSNIYKARYLEKTTSSCPAQNSGYTNKNLGGTSQTTLFDLEWGTTYCWYARAHNGSNGRNSNETWEFTTPDTASLDDLQISTGGSCGNSISGKSSIADVDNPITIMTEYSLNDNGIRIEDIDEVLLSIVPDDVRNASIVSEQSIAQESDQYFMAKAEINTITPGLSKFSMVNTSSFPYYGGEANSGNLSNSFGSATLLNVNGAGADQTHVEVVDADTLRVYWQIRFDDNFKYKTDGSLYNSVINGNVYTAALRELIPGVWNSSTGSNTINRSLSKEANWGVNVQPPQISVGSPQINGSTQFSVDWEVEGHQINQADGIMWSNRSGYQIQRISPIPATLNIPDSEPADFSPTNIGVGIGRGNSLGTHTYQTISPQSVILQTKMSANDTACNRVTDSGSVINLSGGWLMTVGGHAYANNFNTNVVQSNIAGELSYLNNYSYLSTYLSAINQNNIGTPTRASKSKYITTSYNDWNADPSKISQYTEWYEFIKSLLEGKEELITTTSNTIAEELSTGQFISQIAGKTVDNDNFTYHVSTSGNLTLNGKNACNTRTIFFVNGDLNIEPDFEIANRSSLSAGSRLRGSTEEKQMGCMFVVNGNVTIGSGDFNNYYDKIEAFIIAKGSFTTTEDDGGNPLNARYDGLYVKGSITASQFVLGRSLKLIHNIDKPSEIIEYDPRYSHLFFDELKIEEYSIREKNYQKNLY